MMHPTNDLRAKLAEMANSTLSDIASEILTLEYMLEECSRKLEDAKERLSELEPSE